MNIANVMARNRFLTICRLRDKVSVPAGVVFPPSASLMTLAAPEDPETVQAETSSTTDTSNSFVVGDTDTDSSISSTPEFGTTFLSHKGKRRPLLNRCETDGEYPNRRHGFLFAQRRGFSHTARLRDNKTRGIKSNMLPPHTYTQGLDANPTGYEFKDVDESWRDRFRHVFKVLPIELKKWYHERKEFFMRPIDRPELWDLKENTSISHGDMEILFKFDSHETLKKFKTGTDASAHQGYSTLDVSLSPRKTVTLKGNLDTTPPKSGVVQKAGWAAFKSRTLQRSFYRTDVTTYEKMMRKYTHVIIKCRGDGRTWMFNFQSEGTHDINFFDQYAYPLFTHGGPYWQVMKIPFSKFYLTAIGRIQSQQRNLLESSNINGVCLTLMDTKDGPYYLELDFIGFVHDSTHDEDFAYELYKYHAPVGH